MTQTEKTRLVLSQSPLVLTGYREGDARTALTRGLAEYLESIVVNAQGGRQIRFKQVLRTWAEPEQESKYPSAIVYSQVPGVYDSSRFAPGVSANSRLPLPDGRYVVALAEFTLDLNVEIWCTDPHERSELVTAVELAMNPLDYMYGLLLELPFYYNQRAAYEMKDMRYLDSEDDAMRRYRKATFSVTAQIPIMRLATIAEGKPRIQLDSVGPYVILNLVDC